MLKLETFAHRGVSVNVRKGLYNEFDVGIGREVAAEYFWEMLPESVEFAVDVGAHIGHWSLRLSHRYPTAKVVAIEPEKENLAVLAVNAYGYPNVHVRAGAVCYSDKPLGLRLSGDGNSGGHQLVVGDPDGDVIGWTIEDLFEGRDQIDVLKLDCEGSEFDILKNMKVSTLKRIQCIVGEHHSTRDVFHEECGKRLEKAGFELTYTNRVEEMGMFCAVRK
jgi:FkbM family methyltransferase